MHPLHPCQEVGRLRPGVRQEEQGTKPNDECGYPFRSSKTIEPGFPGWKLQFMYNRASFGGMSKGFSRCHGRRKAETQWVKPAARPTASKKARPTTGTSAARATIRCSASISSATWSGRCWSGFDGCDRPRRCRDDGKHRRDSRKERRRRGWSARIADERLCGGRFGQNHGPETAGLSRR